MDVPNFLGLGAKIYSFFILPKPRKTYRISNTQSIKSDKSIYQNIIVSSPNFKPAELPKIALR